MTAVAFHTIRPRILKVAFSGHTKDVLSVAFHTIRPRILKVSGKTSWKFRVPRVAFHTIRPRILKASVSDGSAPEITCSIPHDPSEDTES